MAVVPIAGAGDIAEALPAVLAERSRAAFERMVAADVRWGGEDETEETCHTRQQAGETYEALLAGGTLTVLSTRVGGDQVLARLRVQEDGDSEDLGYESQVLLTARDGVIVDILQLDDEEPPVVELLYFAAGCPNHEAFLPHLRELLASNHVHSPIQLVEVQDNDRAQQLRFLGSPTLRIDGRDVEPDADQRTGYGLQCRVYATAGGATGTPPDSWVLAALQSQQSQP